MYVVAYGGSIKGSIKFFLTGNHPISSSYFISFTIFGNFTRVSDSKSKEDVEVAEKNKRKDAAMKKEASSSDATSKESEDNLRSPICCIMGHVDTGKTKLLDCIRGTNVQEGEAGGITQQIGATYFPAENIRDRTKELKADAKLKVPGLLVIDTPGHESFTNLRTRGSGLCDIAILVVDIMHGLEPQTIESINLLKMRNTEFIVALNKVDRLYGWKTCRNAPIVKAMKEQSRDVQNEFNMRLTQIVTQFKEQGLNTELYYKNREMGETFSIVPTSAISGEGIPDLLLLLVQWTQKTMVEKLTYSNEIQCTVLEVKVIEGHGTTIDVVLVNGVLHEGDQIVVCGMQGPIVTSIRALLTPHPMKELRVKGTYIHHKEIKAAMGIKITAQGLEHAIAGTGLYVVGPDDDLDDVKEEAMEDMNSIGTPICIPQRDFIDIGRVASIENNHKAVDFAKKGLKVAIKIVGTNSEEQQKMFGRHFEIEDELVSHITRRSIDVLKANYREELNMEEWKLVVKLKNLFKIQ
ncbi:eukaryotic translation initiation factor 5b [Quercus suber]|uniref:Eukaryotic translation initiation factor 5b n=1 Tax=Quercus suber TaxID=58331 RepID=A0AAW0JB08_QUESU